jgi:hypothetical protein
MNVKDGLPGIPIGVEHDPIPALEDPLKLGNPPRGQRNIGKKLRIPSSKLPQIPVPLPRHNKHMNPSLRPNIPEGKGGGILIDDISRDLPTDDPFEQSLILGHAQTLSTPVPEGSTAHQPPPRSRIVTTDGSTASRRESVP